MIINDRLKEIGFTPNEIDMYLNILENGASTPPQISKKLGIPRSNIHYLLQNLVGKGVLKKQNKGKRCVYIPNDPSVVMSVFERKRKAMEEVIPDLQALYKKSPNKPVVKFYEGIDEISNIFEDIIEMKGKKLLAFASIKKLFSLMPENFPVRFQKIIKQKEIFFQEILSNQSKDTAEEAKKNMSPYYEYKILSEKYSDFPTDIIIWDDSVVLITLSEPIFGVVITSKSLTDTYRIQFEIMWKSMNQIGSNFVQ